MSGPPQATHPQLKKKGTRNASNITQRKKILKGLTTKGTTMSEPTAKTKANHPQARRNGRAHRVNEVKQTNTKREDRDQLRTTPTEAANPRTLHSREEEEKTPQETRKEEERRSRGRLLRNQCVERNRKANGK